MFTFRAKYLLGAPVAVAALCFSAAVLSTAQTSAQPASNPPATSSPQGVSFQNGRLTINTEGATLAEVLRSAAEKIGAVVEIPAGSGGGRIIEHTTGSADAVLTSLLSGSEFNFVIVTSPGSPHVPTRVLLTPRAGGSSASASEVASVDPGASSEPQLYGGGFAVGPDDEQTQPVQAVAAPPPPPTAASGEQLTPDAIEAMIKERLRLRHEQQQQGSQSAPPAPQ